jgi:GT2 family glycosyltransferase
LSYEFSVVITLYNKQDEIARCIRSVQAQSMKNFEVIVVDDGSQDDGPAIVDSFCRQDGRIHLYRQPNQGVAAARNNGVALAGAEYIAFLDADDEFLENHLTVLAKLVKQHPEAGLLFTGYWIDRGGGWRRRMRAQRSVVSRNCGSDSNYFELPDGCLSNCSVVRKDAYQSVGGERNMFGEDVDRALRMAAAYPVAYCPVPTSVWHVDAVNRRCVQHGESSRLHTPGSLGASLAWITEDANITAGAKQLATSYVARREKQAIVDTLLEGHGSHARYLYDWWQTEFNSRSILVECLLRVPLSILRVARRIKEVMRRVGVFAAYLRDLPVNLATFRSH